MTHINRDTICAISTPPGIGGLAVMRVSGTEAIAIADSLWKGVPLTRAKSHTAHLGMIVDPATHTELDQAVATVYIAPHSFTGDDVVEFAVHGSRYVQRELLNLLIANGCRLAEAGEFTRRAFTAGRLDLAEAEAVADVIASNSRAAHRIAMTQMRGDYSRKLTSLRQKLTDLAALLELELDFSEEDVEFASRDRLRHTASDILDEVTRLYSSFAAGKAIKDGIPVAIVGDTNAGKSSLLNALLGEDRAIVSDTHGTTRDTIEETLELDEYTFRFIDTAGLRHTTDDIERQGISRSKQAIARATVIIHVIDPAAPTHLSPGLIADIMRHADRRQHLITVHNKSDLRNGINAISHTAVDSGTVIEGTVIDLSAKTGHGIDQLLQALTQAADKERGTADEDLLVTNARHAEALRAASQSARRIIDGLDSGLTGDLIALDLRETIDHLASITGDITSADILATIFSRFCIGK